MSNEKVIVKQGLIGGTSSDLDSISYASMVTGNIALVIDGNLSYRYEYNSANSESENPPYVIAPDDVGANPGRWLLKDNYSIIKDNLLLNSEFTVNQREYPADGVTTLANNEYGHDMWVNRTGSTQKYKKETNGDIDLYSIEIGQKNDEMINEDGNYLTFSIESGEVQIIGAGIAAWTVVTPTTPITWIYNVADNSGFIELKKSGVNKFKRPKLERGSYSTRFETVKYSQESINCYYYFWKYIAAFETSRNASSIFNDIAFPIEMRDTPTSTVTSFVNTDSSSSTSSTIISGGKKRIKGFQLNTPPGSGTYRFEITFESNANY